MHKACLLHDHVNLFLLPLLGVLTISGWFGLIDAWLVTVVLTAYIALDFLWIAAIPKAVPSLPKVILLHHLVTLVLLYFPLCYPRFGVYTCLDGLAEVNTFFLIARRQWRNWAGVHDALYWVTFVPCRLGMYPWLLTVFWKELAGHPTYERALCCGAQAALCLFNAALLHLSIANLRKQAAKRRAASAAAATAESKVPVADVSDAPSEKVAPVQQPPVQQPSAAPASKRHTHPRRVVMNAFKADGRMGVALQPRIPVKA